MVTSNTVRSVDKETLVRQLRDLGVRPAGVLLVHTAFSEIRPVEGGPRGLIEALRASIGVDGTLVMPSMTEDDDHPFDLRSTPCPGMGAVADVFWRLPGVIRSDSPHAFAAIGPQADGITASHPIDTPHGHDSPVGRVYDLNGQVLLLGVEHDASTTIHLAENLAGVRYRREKHATIVQDGRPVRTEYREIDHCCRNFSLVDRWLDAQHLQHRARIGNGQARLARSRDIVGVALAHLQENETVFLHPRGVDEECDDAWESL